MNIYEKIENVKTAFLETKIDKKGNNTFVKFKYFRLDELIPILIKTTKENKLATNFTIEFNTCKLIITNIEKPEEKVEFQAPFTFDEVSKNKTQEVGKSITYMRRYLLLMAFDIIEEEVLDKELGQKPKQTPKKEAQIYKAKFTNFIKDNNLDMNEMAVKYGLNKTSTDEDFQIALTMAEKELRNGK